MQTQRPQRAAPVSTDAAILHAGNRGRRIHDDTRTEPKIQESTMYIGGGLIVLILIILLVVLLLRR